MEPAALDKIRAIPLSEEEVAECNRAQMKEMERHKYFESIKANKDVGKAAYADWIMRFGKVWREEWFRRRIQGMKMTSKTVGD